MRDSNSRPPDYQSYILEVTRCMAACLYFLERRWNRAGVNYIYCTFLEVTRITWHLLPVYLLKRAVWREWGHLIFQINSLEVTHRMAALVLLSNFYFLRSIRHQFQSLDVRAREVLEAEVCHLLTFLGLLHYLRPTGFRMPHHKIVY